MSHPNASPDPPWPDGGTDESEPREPASPFLEWGGGFPLGSRSLPAPRSSEANPISVQIAAAPLVQQQQIQPPTAAGIPQRAAAKLTDWFLTGVVYLLAVAGWVSRMDWLERPAAISLALFLAIPASWVTWSLYNVLLNGRTVGKRLFGLEVVTETWDPLSPGRNFGRVWAESLSGGLLGIGYLLALFDPARRTLHDHLCGTRVILRPAR